MFDHGERIAELEELVCRLERSDDRARDRIKRLEEENSIGPFVEGPSVREAVLALAKYTGVRFEGVSGAVVVPEVED